MPTLKVSNTPTQENRITLAEIVQMARKIRDTLRNGLVRAAHYLRSLGFECELARWALLGA